MKKNETIDANLEKAIRASIAGAWKSIETGKFWMAGYHADSYDRLRSEAPDVARGEQEGTSNAAPDPFTAWVYLAVAHCAHFLGERPDDRPVGIATRSRLELDRMHRRVERIVLQRELAAWDAWTALSERRFVDFGRCASMWTKWNTALTGTGFRSNKSPFAKLVVYVRECEPFGYEAPRS